MLPELFPRVAGTLANVNGEVIPLSDVRISALDRGFLYGDAVYEVLRIYGGKLWLAEEHFRRLELSLSAIRITGIDLTLLRKRMEETLRESGYREGIAYLQITRGAAPRRHPFPEGATPLELIYVQEMSDPYVNARKTGVKVIVVPDVRWQRCDVKSTNLLANVLAAQEAAAAGCFEAILSRPAGTLTEGSHTNFFGVRDGAVVTAPHSSSILPGITRNLIVELAKESDIPVIEDYVRLEHVDQLSEAFLSGTTSEVMPIIAVDQRTIGSGEPGPIARKLQQAFQHRILEFAS